MHAIMLWQVLLNTDNVCLSVCLSIYRSIYLSIYLSIDPSIHPSIPPSVHLSVRPSVGRSVCPSIHPSIHLKSPDYGDISAGAQQGRLTMSWWKAWLNDNVLSKRSVCGLSKASFVMYLGYELFERPLYTPEPALSADKSANLKRDLPGVQEQFWLDTFAAKCKPGQTVYTTHMYLRHQAV